MLGQYSASLEEAMNATAYARAYLDYLDNRGPRPDFRMFNVDADLAKALERQCEGAKRQKDGETNEKGR